MDESNNEELEDFSVETGSDTITKALRHPLELFFLWVHIYFLGSAFQLDPFLHFCVLAQMAANYHIAGLKLDPLTSVNNKNSSPVFMSSVKCLVEVEWCQECTGL